MARYSEDGFVMNVDILADNSNGEYESYELRVTEIVRENGLYKPPQIGSTFTCDRKKGCAYAGMWRLEKQPAESGNAETLAQHTTGKAKNGEA